MALHESFSQRNRYTGEAKEITIREEPISIAKGLALLRIHERAYSADARKA